MSAATGEGVVMGWEPIDITTPVKWQAFVGRQIGHTSLGFAAAFSWHSWMFGFEVLGDQAGISRGIALIVGPLWLGIMTLRPPRLATLTKEPT